MGSILSIDYGLKRVGIAFSDSNRIFSFPHGFIENKSFDYLAEEIKKIVGEKEIDLIIIGMPFNMPGIKDKKSEMTLKVENFIKKLSSKVPNIKIESVDERLSSFIAEERLKEAGISSKKSRKLVDAEAARLILEDYIEKNVR